MTCNCIEKGKKTLKNRYGCPVELGTHIMPDGTERFLIGGSYRKPMKNGRSQEKKVWIYPKYCPICGKPYNEKEIKEE